MLYLITNRKIVTNGKYFDVIKNAILAGVDAIIVREKDLPTEDLMLIAKEIKSLIKNYAAKKVTLIINTNEKVAISIDADGLHLGFNDFMKFDRRFNGIMGVSVHSIEEAVLSQEKGANYVLAGHVFQTKSKKGLEGRGVDFIKAIKDKVTIPVIALGGITHLNVKEVLNAGADGIAVMSYIMSSKDSYKSASLIKNIMSAFNLN